MAGIYIHFPFCKQACHYCDFHFSTSLKYKDDMLNALVKEIGMQQHFFGGGERIDTVYFGGGTPSLLNEKELERIIMQINDRFDLDPNAEITLEANPDDLDANKIRELAGSPVNRLSIGIQSFFDEDLRWMNRAHNAQEADASVRRSQDSGMENITVDLIYGYPLLSDAKWMSNLQKVIELDVPHLSAYSMTVEPGTALSSFIHTGKQKPMNENQSAAQFDILTELIGASGFEQYEISNFALEGCRSRHNSNYWKGVPYLGIGPSAHSYYPYTRQWNVANNHKYMEAIEAGRFAAEREELSPENRLNEYIMTSLRTVWGLDLEKVGAEFGTDTRKQLEQGLESYRDSGHILLSGAIARLSHKGKLLADAIAADLFVDTEHNDT